MRLSPQRSHTVRPYPIVALLNLFRFSLKWPRVSVSSNNYPRDRELFGPCRCLKEQMHVSLGETPSYLHRTSVVASAYQRLVAAKNDHRRSFPELVPRAL